MSDLELREYQQAAVDMVRESMMRGHTRTVLVLPTGGGKTEIAVAIARMTRQKSNGKLWFIVDRKTLARQARDRFQKYGIRCGLMQGENTELAPEDEAVVATVQTLKSRFDKNPLQFDPDIIVVDEVHCLYEMHTKLLEFREVPTIGLTATPSNDALGKWFTNMVVPVTMGHLIDEGHLVPFKAYAPSMPDLTNVRFERGDFVESDLESEMSSITGDVIHHWKTLAHNRPTIAFCVNVNHAREMASQFCLEGIPAAMVYAKTPDDERLGLYDQLASGEIKVITSVLVLGVGFDLPEASVAILARPTASEALHVQQCGRVARTHESKEDAILLDHAGNIIRHGMPHHYDPPPLGDGEKRVSKERKVKEKRAVSCTSCGAIMEPGQQTCPVCDFERVVTSDVVMVDGHLVEIDLDEHPEQRELTHAYRRRFYKELLGYAELHGYKKGWAVHKYQDRYGELPWEDGCITRYKSITHDYPSEETLRWIDNRIKYERIRKAKSKRD